MATEEFECLQGNLNNVILALVSIGICFAITIPKPISLFLFSMREKKNVLAEIWGPDPQGSTGKIIPNPFCHQEGALLKEKRDKYPQSPAWLEQLLESKTSQSWCHFQGSQWYPAWEHPPVSKVLGKTWISHWEVPQAPLRDSRRKVHTAVGTAQTLPAHFASSLILCFSEVLHFS